MKPKFMNFSSPLMFGKIPLQKRRNTKKTVKMASSSMMWLMFLLSQSEIMAARRVLGMPQLTAIRAMNMMIVIGRLKLSQIPR